MEMKRVTEGAGKKTICREMEIMAIQAKDDQLYQEVIRAVQEEREMTDYPQGHEMKAFFRVWGSLALMRQEQAPWSQWRVGCWYQRQKDRRC